MRGALKTLLLVIIKQLAVIYFLFSLKTQSIFFTANFGLFSLL